MGAAEVLLVCALDLLGRSRESFPLIKVVQQRPAAASERAVAFVDRRDRSITLIGSAPVVREATAAVERYRGCRERAPVALIASVLVHEEWHLLHGPDEAPAYAIQLTTLQALGFGPDSAPFHAVRKGMLAVAARGR